ncbi:tetratricopeptide repeat protein [Joostella sp.]|uniref:tetratricopeptide repeat protein n=1 Tax=Joostella sp. TaxID=2231138 RepID=UPI003A8FB136
MIRGYKILYKSIVLVLFLLISVSGLAQQESSFQEGNDFYHDGEYQEAIDAYLKAEKGNLHSVALYYNLANSYYKLNEIAPSIYYYEKALLLNPDDEDVKNNLKFAQQMTVDAIEVLPQVGIDKIFGKLINKFSYATWAILAIVFMVLFVLAFLLYYFANYHTKKRVFFAISIIFMIASIGSFVFAHSQYGAVNAKDPAIIFAKGTPVMSEPNMGSTEVFLLHEGTKVNVLDTVGEWKKIRLTDGKIGWLPSSEIKIIKDF